MGTVLTDAYEFSAKAAPPTPLFARPSTPKRGDGESPVKARQSPLKTIRYATNRTPAPLSQIVDISTITPGQKELATRIHKAAEQLQQWCREIERWHWDGSFNLPSEEVDRHEDELDAISHELSQINLEELKEHVLSIFANRSRPGSSHTLQTIARLPFQFLDDYELFVTQTLIQALPQMVLLRHYLRAWSTRILVLREVPIFLAQLYNCRQCLSSDMTKSWEPVSPNSQPHQLSQLQRNIHSAQKELETLVRSAGARLDAMLDMLEASDDCLPDDWIEDYESLETQYSSWTVEAETWIMQIEFAKHKALAKTDSDDDDNIIHLDDFTPLATPSVKHRSAFFLESEPSTSESGDASLSDFINEPDSKTPEPIDLKESDTPAERDVDVPDTSNFDSPEQDSTSIHPQADGTAETQDDASELPIQSTEPDEEEPRIAEAEVFTVIRRASVASVNSFQKSQLKTVNVRRSSSRTSSLTIQSRLSMKESSSAPVSPVSPANSISRRQSWFTNPTSPLSMTMVEASKNSSPESPATPVSPVIPESPDESSDEPAERSRFSQSDRPSSELERPSSPEDSPLAGDPERSQLLDDSPSLPRQVAKAPRPPLNNSMPKRRPQDNGNLTPVASNVPSSHPSYSPTEEAQSSPLNAKTSTLDQQISAIINRVHAPIRLTTSSPVEPAAPVVASSKSPKHRRLPSLRTKLHQHRTITPQPQTATRSTSTTLTLAPASKEEARKAGATDPEIKLYHLTGREGKPIKLFVRRIGENGERVMVRVGGGWADLGEYLRVYAEHHGSHAMRAASEGKVEVLGLGSGTAGRATPEPPKSTGHSRKPSLAATASPESASELSSPFSASVGARSPSDSLIQAANLGNTTIVSSPAGISSSPPSAGPQRRTSSASWQKYIGGDRSLAGPAGDAKKKAEMSDAKRDWVDGIVEQAKKLHFGLDPAGNSKDKGTKRVFLKGKD